MVAGQAMLIAGTGLLAGLPGAFGLARAMKSVIYEVSASDPAVFAAVPLVLAATAAVASYLPARRAARVTPAAALRCE
jgi:ABC-type antimicrobial peptide transport system permease subunit